VELLTVELCDARSNHWTLQVYLKCLVTTFYIPF